MTKEEISAQYLEAARTLDPIHITNVVMSCLQVAPELTLALFEDMCEKMPNDQTARRFLESLKYLREVQSANGIQPLATVSSLEERQQQKETVEMAVKR